MSSEQVFDHHWRVGGNLCRNSSGHVHCGGNVHLRGKTVHCAPVAISVAAVLVSPPSAAPSPMIDFHHHFFQGGTGMWRWVRTLSDLFSDLCSALPIAFGHAERVAIGKCDTDLQPAICCRSRCCMRRLDWHAACSSCVVWVIRFLLLDLIQ